MSNESITTLKKDLGQVKEYWKSLDPKVRRLDSFAVLQILIFAISFVYVSVADVTPIVSNTAMMIYPLLMAGFTFVYRSKVHANPDNAAKALGEFTMFFIIISAMVLFTYIYAAFL